jgi:hypothetical protein
MCQCLVKRGVASARAHKLATPSRKPPEEPEQPEQQVLAAVAGIVKIPGNVKELQKLATMSKKETFGKVRSKRWTGWMVFVSEQVKNNKRPGMKNNKRLGMGEIGARWSGMGDDEKQKYKDLAAARNKKPDRPAAEAAVRLKTFNEIETTIETPAAVNKQEPVCFIT